MQFLRPEEWTARRDAFPVAYIPIGNLEWHGFHNPMGADTIQAEGLCEELARLGGGVVFPPLYYGDNRSEALMDSNPGIGEEICAALGLKRDAAAQKYQPFTVTEQTYNYSRLLLHILAEAESYGFRVGVLAAGHYPLIDHAYAAALLHNKRRARPEEDRMLAYACIDFLAVRDQYACAGDHGAGWETSHLMHLCPDSVDLSRVPAPPEKALGCDGAMHPAEASAAFGAQTLRDAAQALLPEIRLRVEHPGRFRGHGMSLR